MQPANGEGARTLAHRFYRADRLAVAAGKEVLEFHPSAPQMHVRRDAVENGGPGETVHPLNLCVRIARLDLKGRVYHRDTFKAAGRFLRQKIQTDFGLVGL